MNTADSAYATAYFEYLTQLQIELPVAIQTRLESTLAHTNWEEPSTGADWNNVGVAALIQAAIADDEAMRAVYVEMAFEAFQSGAELHPLCTAHWAVLCVLTGDRNTAKKMAFQQILRLQSQIDGAETAVPTGLLYLPGAWYTRPVDRQGLVESLYGTANGLEQAYHWLGQIISKSEFVFYNPNAARSLAIASHVNPAVPVNLLQAGLASLMRQQIEGFLLLHQAHRLAPADLTLLQSLYIAYKDLGDEAIAQQYFSKAKAVHTAQPQLAGRWTELAEQTEFTYIPFNQSLILAVQPSFKSIVTSVLLASGDWFETEMELWRSWLQPGMTVIDVGANAGVYTFSAAAQVEANGKVIAIEPFPACVSYLQETCRVNQLDWVRVYGAAASDRTGNIRLAVQGASELNEVVADDVEVAAGQVVEVPCLTLDSLIENESLTSVDFLKLDAEGHELNVLQGALQLLKTFAPVILYENIAGAQGSNLVVAEFLMQQGYELNIYQPYLKQLVPLNSLTEVKGQLNLVATPKAAIAV